MPRRRMLDPSFFDDTYVAKLTRDERLFLLGCIRNSDDEGRLKGHSAYLKAEIFMYDDDITLDRMHEMKEATLEKMKQWPEDNPWRMVPYENSGADYIYFPGWFRHQAPSHPQPSQLPVPPGGASLGEPFTDKLRQEIYERDNYICQYCGTDLSQQSRNLSIDHVIPLTKGGTHNRENLVTACKSCNLKKRNRTPQEAGMALIPDSKAKVNLVVNPEVNHRIKEVNHPVTQVRSGQVSIGKVSIGKSSEVLEDFTKFLDSEKDLTDFLTKTLTEYLPRGPTWLVEVLNKLWKQALGEKMNQQVFEGTLDAVRKYPPIVLAGAYAKAVKYRGGKYGSWKYVDKILKEQVGKEKGPP